MTLRFLVDECIPGAIVEALRSCGEEVEWVREVAPRASDRNVISRSVEMGAVIVTEDRDFGELVFGSGKALQGIVLIRLSRFAGPVGVIAPGIAERISGIDGGLLGRMTVIEPSRTRQRALPGKKRE